MDFNQEQFFALQQSAQKMPLHMNYPVQSLYMSELEYQQDMERMKELYPEAARRIQDLVEEECDKMEYEGSLMFDEYPDRLMLRRICDRIYQKVSQQMEQDMTAQNVGTRNLIEVLLFNEMFNRRCRHRRCRRWW